MSPYGPYDRNPLVAELYDFTPLYAARADVAFYVDCARQVNGATLELGCSTQGVDELVPREPTRSQHEAALFPCGAQHLLATGSVGEDLEGAAGTGHSVSGV